MRIEHYKKVGSTNTVAFKLAEQGAREWTSVIADVQTSGRGRAGRRWASPKGGLWLSIILRPSISPRKIGLIQFLAAFCVSEAIRKLSRVEVGLKWPNDIMLESRKLGGVLLETKTALDNVSFVIVGVGINIKQSSRTLPERAISLSEATERRVSPRKLATTIAMQLRRNYGSLDHPKELLAGWWEECVHRSLLVRIQTSNGIVEGVNSGIDEEGRLIVNTRAGHSQIVEDGTLTIPDVGP